MSALVGPNSCGTCSSSVVAGGFTWGDLTLTALEGDEVNAVGGDAAANPSAVDVSNPDMDYLQCTNFGFSLPTGSIVRGILFEVYRKEGVATGDVFDLAIRLIKGGSIQGTDRSNGTEWPTAFAYQTYGSATDLWGATLTIADVIASNFGIAIRCHTTSGSAGANGSGAIQIDHVRGTVYYDLPGDFGAAI